MSPKPLSTDTLKQLYDEIIDHMKRSGAFDDIRVKLIQPIWEAQDFDAIIRKFETECEIFCGQHELNQNRNTLRAKLAARFDDHYSGSKRKVKEHIDNILKAQEAEVKSEYFNHARTFLEKFLPQSEPTPPPPTPPPPPPSPPPLPPSPPSKTLEAEHDLHVCTDMDIDNSDDEEIEKPPYSPIVNDDISPIGNDISPIGNEDISPLKDADAEISPVEKNEFSPVEEDDIPLPMEENDDDRLTFSTVSSVDTADLSDFDNSIKLSDDEATIVGKPKNSKVPIEEIQGQIEDLECEQEPAESIQSQMQNDIQCKQEPSEDNKSLASNLQCKPEPIEQFEATGKRATRSRIPNTRYKNDFIHTYK